MTFTTLTKSAVLAAMLVGSASAQTVLHVDESADQTPHDGSDWCHAYLELYEALAVAGPDTIIQVADGTYVPDTSGLAESRDATFPLANGVSIKGGYAGCAAPDPDARDPLLYTSTLSGDLNGDDDTDGDNSENCYHVLTGSGTNATALLDGVTISAGNANGEMSNRNGGGRLIENGAPTLIQCVFSDNEAIFGGGLFNSYGTPSLTDCTFSGNSASGSGGGMYNFSNPAQQESATLMDCTFTGNSAAGYGGGMRNFDSNPTLNHCTFEANLAVARGGGMANGGSSSPTLDTCLFTGNGVQSFSVETYGGGMSNFDSSDPALTDCTFVGNSATGFPGMGGAIFNSGTAPTLTGCTLVANAASHGGAMYNDGANPTLANCIFRLNSAGTDGGAIYSFSSGAGTPVTLTNCLFSANTTNGDGGGLFSDLSALTLTNCTFNKNTAGSQGGGLYNYVGCDIKLTNSILWDNNDVDGNVESSQILNNPSNGITVDYTCLQGLTGSFGGTANIGSDPQFVDPDGPDNLYGTQDDDLRLAPDSPAIDAGDNLAVAGSTDLDGNPRIVDSDRDGTATVDLGAYEVQGVSPPIPAVSDWGVLALTLLLLTVGTVAFRRGPSLPQPV